MNPKPIILILTGVLLAGTVAGCSMFGGEETPEAVVIESPPQPNVVSAEAFVAPVRQARLGFEVGGRLDSLTVEEGEEVSAGQLLAELENSSQKAAVSQAEANLGQAEAQLSQVVAGPTAEEIAEAEAGLAGAEARLAELVAGPTAEDIAQAEAAVQTARASLAQVLAGTRAEDIQAAATTLLQAEAEVRLRQADYDRYVYGDPEVAEPYGVALQKATLEYERAKATYDKLVAGPTAEEVGVARARVGEAEAALAKVKGGATAEQIGQAQAEVARAEAGLARLKAGATVEEIAVAEAGVKSAAAGVSTAEVELAKTQLYAPFKGTVGLVEVEAGELVQGGSGLVWLGDTSEWQIETDDLTEIDVVRVREGAAVSISVDALPGEEYEGRVKRITPQSETKAGDVTYTVVIEITGGKTELLRWGMTTFVDIEAGPEL